MTEESRPTPRVVDDSATAWTGHPRFTDIRMKQLLTSTDNPMASVNRVQVPPGGVIGWHQHVGQVETVYVLAGQSVLTLGDSEVTFGRSQIVAIPSGLDHTLHNIGPDTVELLCFFTPPWGG